MIRLFPCVSNIFVAHFQIVHPDLVENLLGGSAQRGLSPLWFSNQDTKLLLCIDKTDFLHGKENSAAQLSLAFAIGCDTLAFLLPVVHILKRLCRDAIMLQIKTFVFSFKKPYKPLRIII